MRTIKRVIYSCNIRRSKIYLLIPVSKDEHRYFLYYREKKGGYMRYLLDEDFNIDKLSEVCHDNYHDYVEDISDDGVSDWSINEFDARWELDAYLNKLKMAKELSR